MLPPPGLSMMLTGPFDWATPIGGLTINRALRVRQRRFIALGSFIVILGNSLAKRRGSGQRYFAARPSPHLHSFDEHHLAGPGSRVTAREGCIDEAAVIAPAVHQQPRQMYDLAHAQPCELRADGCVSRDHVSIGAVLDHVLTRNGRRRFGSPGIEACTLRNVEGPQDAIVGHGPPSESKILGDEIRDRVELIVFPTENACRDVVARARAQRPVPVLDWGGSLQIRLQRVSRSDESIRGTQGPRLPLLPRLPQSRHDQGGAEDVGPLHRVMLTGSRAKRRDHHHTTAERPRRVLPRDRQRPAAMSSAPSTTRMTLVT